MILRANVRCFYGNRFHGETSNPHAYCPKAWDCRSEYLSLKVKGQEPTPSFYQS